MSLHRPEKRLAVLESMIDQKLSIRDAAKLHGVAKDSAHKWLIEHRSGDCTIGMLRQARYKAAAPVQDEISLEEVLRMHRRMTELKTRLEAEKEALVKRLAEIDTALAGFSVRKGRSRK